MNNHPRCHLTKNLSAFIATLFIMTFSSHILLADAPEEKVWEDTPSKAEPAKIGPQNESFPLAKYQHVLYVSASKGSDTAQGLSRGDALKTIDAALGRASDPGRKNRYAILVAGGEYRGPEIKMKRHVDLYGGFDPSTWERDIFNSQTVLDGGGKHR
ncbi:MAG: hypothetical protein ACYTE8_07470, partial [Planctomycetota bacterium]